MFVDFHNYDKSPAVLKEHLADLKQKLTIFKQSKTTLSKKIEFRELLLSKDQKGKSLEDQQCVYQSFLNSK